MIRLPASTVDVFVAEWTAGRYRGMRVGRAIYLFFNLAAVAESDKREASKVWYLKGPRAWQWLTRSIQV